ncbi:Hypothetical predicted protein [Mytilus galloprovincialis]|uniref:Uncharacterized protein n=1 Tax=Mytilus galloprovincialis TaxID=29158 RepID=A0A8B6DWP0_MYTGA|nr:Hypothetical predicted protein [Mytilus galloprovincialis]
MEYYWKLNSMIIVITFRLFVTALGSETRDRGNEDPLSIPLINDKGAPLVAMLDTNAINRKMKVYIRTLMRDMIQSSMQVQMQGIFQTSLEENSTIDFIRNITLQEINEVLKEQGQEGTGTIMRDMIKSSIQEQIQGILKTSLEENPTIDFIRNITLQEIKDVLKEQHKEGISSSPIGKYKDCTELKKKTDKKLNDGVYSIYPGGDNPVQAYCDMTTDGGMDGMK